MARVRGPLMSVEARGRVGNDLLYRQGRSGAQVYRMPDPTRVNQQPASEAQQDVRQRYQEAAQAWKRLRQWQRASWNARAKTDPRDIHGWALFLEAWTGAEPPPDVPDPSTYVAPPGDACDFPGYTWTSDTTYTPPPGDRLD